MSEPKNQDEVKFTIVQSEKFPEGGRVYIVATGEPFIRSIEVEFRDYRIGSFQLWEYIEDKIKETEAKYRYEYGHFFKYPPVFSRLAANIAFGTDFELFPEKLQSETVEHSEFGRVLIECLKCCGPEEEGEDEEGVIY